MESSHACGIHGTPTFADKDHEVEDTYLARCFGLIEYIRRLREDQLSVLVPEVFTATSSIIGFFFSIPFW